MLFFFNIEQELIFTVVCHFVNLPFCYSVNLSQILTFLNMSYGATVGASAANSNLIEFKK